MRFVQAKRQSALFIIFMAVGGSRFYACVMYPENMVDDWQLLIGDLLKGLPYAYCIHDKDLRRERKIERKKHVHVMIVFRNTTTESFAYSIFGCLNAEGKESRAPWCEVVKPKHYYNYLIHDTETCRNQHKHLYDKSERIEGNNFDIGAYEQLSKKEMFDIRLEIDSLIFNNDIYNYDVFYECFYNAFSELDNFEDYMYVLDRYDSHFDRHIRGKFQRMITSGKYKK